MTFSLEPKDTHFSLFALLCLFFQFFSQLEGHCGKHERVSPRSPSREDCCPSPGVLSVDGLYLSDP